MTENLNLLPEACFGTDTLVVAVQLCITKVLSFNCHKNLIDSTLILYVSRSPPWDMETGHDLPSSSHANGQDVGRAGLPARLFKAVKGRRNPESARQPYRANGSTKNKGLFEGARWNLGGDGRSQTFGSRQAKRRGIEVS
jgi:hypothetical protein